MVTPRYTWGNWPVVQDDLADKWPRALSLELGGVLCGSLKDEILQCGLPHKNLTP